MFKPQFWHTAASNVKGSATPSVPTLNVVPIYGQSLGLGTDPDTDPAVVVSGTANTTHRRFNAGVRAHYDTAGVGNGNPNAYIDPASMVSMVNLNETINPDGTLMGETIASGIGSRMTNKSLFYTMARGAYRVEWLSLFSSAKTDRLHFVNMVAGAIAASEFAKAAGEVLTMPYIAWMHGEADATVDTPRATYKTLLTTLVDDLRTYLTIATETDVSGLKFLMYQQGMGVAGYAEIARAMVELHRDDPTRYVCYGPGYWREATAVNDVHLNAAGYRNEGELIGLFTSGQRTQPCHITGSPVRSGTTITIPIHVPTPPLVFGSITIADQGFTYSGAGIDSVTITDTGVGDNVGQITIELDADAAGDLTYAYNNGTALRIGPTDGPRGNVRDSASEVSNYDSTALYNYMLTDFWSVT